MASPVKRSATIEGIERHDENLRSYLIRPDRRVPVYIPGQFLHLALDEYRMGEHWPESRVFSIANAHEPDGRLRITVSLKGDFTTRMFQSLEIGARVWLKLPCGHFFLQPERERATILLAGGSGVTPFTAFIEDVAKRGAATGPIVLHYAARTPKLLVYRAMLEECRRRLDQLSVVYYAENEAPIDGGIVRGRIPETGWGSAEQGAARYFLSGPKVMVETYCGVLSRSGIPGDAMFVDEWE